MDAWLKQTQEMLSFAETLELMRLRREMQTEVLNLKIRWLMRRDLQRSNSRAIEAAIEQNRASNFSLSI